MLSWYKYKEHLFDKRIKSWYIINIKYIVWKESGIGMLGEMLAADGRKNKVYYLQRTKSIDKLAYGGCRDRQVHMKTISTVDSIDINGDIILLMDDVTTTGNSLYACREYWWKKVQRQLKCLL